MSFCTFVQKHEILDGCLAVLAKVFWKNTASLWQGGTLYFPSFLLRKSADDGKDDTDEHSSDADTQQRAGQEILHGRAADRV